RFRDVPVEWLAAAVEILELPGPFVASADEDEDAGLDLASAGQERLDRVAAEVWVDRHRVGRPGGLVTECGLRIRLGRGRDVVALAVEDGEEAQATGLQQHLAQRPHPSRTARLEEGALWLHDRHQRRHDVEDAQAEFLE